MGQAAARGGEEAANEEEWDFVDDGKEMPDEFSVGEGAKVTAASPRLSEAAAGGDEEEFVFPYEGVVFGDEDMPDLCDTSSSDGELKFDDGTDVHEDGAKSTVTSPRLSAAAAGDNDNEGEFVSPYERVLFGDEDMPDFYDASSSDGELKFDDGTGVHEDGAKSTVTSPRLSAVVAAGDDVEEVVLPPYINLQPFGYVPLDLLDGCISDGELELNDDTDVPDDDGKKTVTFPSLSAAAAGDDDDVVEEESVPPSYEDLQPFGYVRVEEPDLHYGCMDNDGSAAADNEDLAEPISPTGSAVGSDEDAGSQNADDHHIPIADNAINDGQRVKLFEASEKADEPVRPSSPMTEHATEAVPLTEVNATDCQEMPRKPSRMRPAMVNVSSLVEYGDGSFEYSLHYHLPQYIGHGYYRTVLFDFAAYFQAY